MKKIILLILLTLLISCNKQESDFKKPVFDKVSNVYKTTQLDIQHNIIGSIGYFIHDDKIHYLCTESIESDSDANRQVLYKFDYNGENIEHKILSENTSDFIIVNYFIDNNDHIIYLTHDIQNNSYKIYKYFDNELIFEHDVKELLRDENEHFGILSINIDNEDDIYISTNRKIYVLSNDFKVLFTIDIDDNKTVMGVYTDKNGDIIIQYRNRNNYTQTLQYFDKNSKTLGNQIKLPSSFKYSNYYQLFFGNGFDLYIKDSEGLFGYNIGDDNVELLINWTNSDLVGDGVNNIIPISPEKIICSGYDFLSGKGILYIMTKIPDDEIKEKKIIRFGMTHHIDVYIRSLINNFNRTNDEYRIIIEDYTKEDEPFKVLAFSKLDADIIKGNIPDIIYTQQYNEIRNYAEKGLFVDLYDYFDRDKDISADILFDCVKKPFEINSELNSVCLYFTMSGSIGKTSTIGSNSYSIMDLIKFDKQLPDDVILTDQYRKDIITGFYINLIMAHFINFDDNTCDFINDDFYYVLDYLQSLPTEYLYELSGGMEYRYYLCKENKIILDTLFGVNTFQMFLMTQYMFDTDDISFMTFPYKTYNGIKVAPQYNFMITKDSPVKDAAWEFIKSLLIYNSKSTDIVLFGFQSTVDGFKNNAEAAKTDYTFFNNDGGRWSSPETIPENEEMLREAHGGVGKLMWIKDKDIDTLSNMIKLAANFTYTRHLDVIFNLIDEEIQEFYNSDKSIEETAKIIQSRVSIYLSENY